MSGIRGNIGRLSQLAAKFKALPVRLAQDIAQEVAPTLTQTLRTDFDAGRTAFGTARPAGVQGNRLTLVESGRTRAALRFVHIGTRVRVALGTKWAKYLIGLYAILPNNAIPVRWSRQIVEKANAVIQRRLSA